jgi:hypothetical protein
MAYARRYTDKQRAAVLELHEEGVTAVEIAQRCAAGTARCEPFTIPRRSAAQIIETFERQRRTTVANDIGNASKVEITDRNRTEIEAIVADQLARLKGRVKPLSDGEIRRLERLNALNERLRRSRPKTPGRSPARGSSKAPKHALDELAERIKVSEEPRTYEGNGSNDGHEGEARSDEGEEPKAMEA